MTRTLLAIAFAAGMASPALAECTQEADAIESAVGASQLTDDEKEQVGTILNGARQQAEAGDEAACQQTVDQVKVALGIQQ